MYLYILFMNKMEISIEYIFNQFGCSAITINQIQ